MREYFNEDINLKRGLWNLENQFHCVEDLMKYWLGTGRAFEQLGPSVERVYTK